jgi:hypothetical protein
MVDLPDETKDTLLSVLSHAAANERAVVEFTNEDGTLYAKDITDHVAELENIVNE